MKTYEGVIIQENGALYIQTTDGIQLSIGKSFYAFLGRRVWVEADALVESAINIENIVVHQDSNFQFPRGQRVVLRGSLELDGKGGLEFYPNNQHALNLLGHRKSFKLKIDPRSGYASYKSETYLVQLE